MSGDPQIDALMARVGYLMLNWGRVEHEIQAPPPADKKSAKTAIRIWARAHANASQQNERHRERVRRVMLDMGQVRLLRNLVAHGILAASADPVQFPEPTLRCLSVDGATVFVSASQLDAAIATLRNALPELKALNRDAGVRR